MHIINKLADRLLEKVAPTVTADAACKYLSTERFFAVDTRCSSQRALWTVIHYDNCAPKATSTCFG
ncbi:hypothetical protein Aca07nite_54120 [Actinoplanes capillaceus]|uniref:Uncharacterized protein n=1 Tax=Actinoplanes campanulatus TaxID=113559 RepID=A0ABQ3WPJ8_9ACTN|nr:hypothetical protein [Actinoplanes capillaceus]GID48137.1 hypothetical protein Aca07nite_54120 [Actinoplanes capillaceus]